MLFYSSALATRLDASTTGFAADTSSADSTSHELGASPPHRPLSHGPQADATAAFRTHDGVVWRARSLSGALILEYTAVAAAAAERPSAAAALLAADVAVQECRFRFRGAAAIVAAYSPADPFVPLEWSAEAEAEPQQLASAWEMPWSTTSPSTRAAP